MEIKKLQKKLRKLEHKFEKAGPIARGRIMKASEATMARIEKLSR
uniref:Uncharacterized protein n=1 Tax=viral metagenome TaxID=1070528 RepID=A0A6M3IMJ4_9ZZZZ